jgi:hypothetical protein
MIMNKISAAISKMEKTLNEKLEKGETTAEEMEKVSKSMDIEFDEYTCFQNLKSQAYMAGFLNLEEAQTIYTYLGEGGPDKFNSQGLAVKVILTKIFSELLTWKTRSSAA